MEILTKEQFMEAKEDMILQIKRGSVFVYPTDTLYGIGCNAQDNAAVQRIRKIKMGNHPFSVIAPSKEWMLENLECNHEHKEYLDKLPGPYTLICKMKNKDCVSESVNPLGDNTLGCRIPKHWIADIVKELDIPIVTTSVNRTGQAPITKISDINMNTQHMTDFAIDEGELKGQPSTLINLSKAEPEIIERK
ncbi:threonylcarbamoyl-AMP synthase [Candidatus Woesearchaeota archaeon]|nr:threonylcarbamoyl-AMP synthase [Candidatus Woesearchaeota archaeon]